MKRRYNRKCHDQPNVIQPNSVQSNITQPNLEQSNVVNPNVVQSNLVQSNVVWPSSVQSNITQPNVVQPNIVQPNVIQPNIIQSNVVLSNVAPPDVVFADTSRLVRTSTSREIIAALALKMVPLSANAKSQQSLNKSQLVRSNISKPSVQLKTSLDKSELVVARSAARWESTTVSEAQYVLIVS
jgi:hypothetical protein